MVVRELEASRESMISYAKEARLFMTKAGSDDRRDHLRRLAVAYDRQAAHYQQAIDLLTAAPMPPKDEPR